MNLEPLGIATSAVEVTNVSTHGIWLLTGDRELFLAYEDFPWFRNAPISKIVNVQEPTPDHFYWPDLDIDIGVRTIEHPEKFPLKAKADGRSRMPDMTRYDVSICGETYPNLSKTAAIFKVVKSLVELGHSPQEISANIAPGFLERKFRAGYGDLNQIEFIDAMIAEHERFTSARWYTANDELIHYNQQTYAFSRMWGRANFYPAMDALCRSYPSVRYERTAG